MYETTFLSGKVRKWSLPVVERTTAPQPLLKRLLLPHGELAQLYDGEEAVRYIAYVELRKACVRGNHYHEHKQEHLYVIHGEIRLLVKDVDSGACQSIPLRTGDAAVIYTRVAHALETCVSGHAIEFSGVRFNPSDVYPFELIK